MHSPSTRSPEADPNECREDWSETVHHVQGCLLEDSLLSCNSALQVPPCHTDPAGTHGVVSSSIESLVYGSWMPESSYYGDAAAMHISRTAAGVQQLPCSGWLKIAQYGISLLATQI